jgi:hypothetical protein
VIVFTPSVAVNFKCHLRLVKNSEANPIPEFKGSTASSLSLIKYLLSPAVESSFLFNNSLTIADYFFLRTITLLQYIFISVRVLFSHSTLIMMSLSYSGSLLVAE